MCISRWAWSVPWISSNNCSLRDSSSRYDSNNAYYEFLRAHFWISMLHSVESLNWILVGRESLLTLFHRLFIDIDSTTLITEPSLSSLSLSCNGFPFACFSLLLFWRAKLPMRNVRSRGFKHCGNNELSSVLVHGFREVGEIVVRIVDERRVTIHRSSLVKLPGLITCGEGGLGQEAKLLVLVRSALDLRF